MKLSTKTYFCSMNNKLSIPYLIFIVATLFSACGGPETKGNKITALAGSASLNSVAGEKYSIDKKESVITYKGSMALVSKGAHTGYVYISNGDLLFDNGQLVGGIVEIDMNTIADIDHGSENNLVRHLKSADFFDVEKFPFASFAITMVAPPTGGTVNVTGNLTIKGITHAISFPAKIEVTNGVVHSTGNVAIDRTQWDVRYKSGKFGLNLLADDIISDSIEFDIKIVAKK